MRQRSYDLTPGERRPILIDRLAEPYRTALTLTAIEGATQAAAARPARISVPRMKSRVERDRDQLRDLLQACCAVDRSDPQLRGRPIPDGRLSHRTDSTARTAAVFVVTP